MALIDPRAAAEAGLRVLTEPALWGAHHDLTGPVVMSWPEALEVLSAELGEHVTFRVVAERQFLEGLIDAGVPAGTAELLITREWSILAGENEYTTDTFQQITGRPPRPMAEFLHEYRAEFVYYQRITPPDPSRCNACLAQDPNHSAVLALLTVAQPMVAKDATGLIPSAPRPHQRPTT